MLRSGVRHIVVALFLGLSATISVAGEAEDRVALDTLFMQLQAAPDASAAQQITARIWLYWTTPSDPQLAARMREAIATHRMGDIPGAITLLDRLIADYPDYAEGWNQRATLYYVIGNFEASIADCGKVLALEPRHFGALSGRALMYLQLGKRALALKDMSAALAIHPFLDERMLFPELQRDITRI